ncbi:MAG: Holliday junction resolvase RuvX, partial [Pseudomonadota bacterium]
MIVEDPAQFAAALPPLRPLMGLDLGDKTIGVALSDTFLSVASPVET